MKVDCNIDPLATEKYLHSLAEKWVFAKAIVALTGAGVSAESGVPTFSGSNGLLEDEAARKFITAEGYENDPVEAWRFYDLARRDITECQPNSGHIALAELQNSLPHLILATHNVDGLHQRAGSQRVLELSGSLWELRCTEENKIFMNDDVPLKLIPPLCSCGTILRPNVVLFGETLLANPCNELYKVISLQNGILSLVGLSGINRSVKNLISHARFCGWRICEINISETLLSPIADFRVIGRAAKILPLLADYVKRISNQ